MHFENSSESYLRSSCTRLVIFACDCFIIIIVIFSIFYLIIKRLCDAMTVSSLNDVWSSRHHHHQRISTKLCMNHDF